MKELIVGANGFLGQHLAWSRRHTTCLLHSRSAAGVICQRTGLPFLQEDLVETHQRLHECSPEIVYLLARPSEQNAQVLLQFTHHVQALLRAWADRGCLRRVVFASSQLVYATPRDDTPLTVDAPLSPENAYDCHKAEMEFFLSLLSHHPSGLKADIYRLPLLGGGRPTASQTREQILYAWRVAYQQGLRWEFPDYPNADRWGNSWVHVDDVVRLMTEGNYAPRFAVVQPVSGHLRYRELDRWFREQSSGPAAKGPLHLPRTSFFLEDNVGVRPRTLPEAFA